MIEVYTLPNCKTCKEVKEYLKSKNVEYEEIDMSVGGNKKTIDRKRQFKSIGLKTYPVVIIDDDFIIPEFDKDVIDNILEKIK